MTALPPPSHPGDIVQITDQTNRWFPALVVIHEVKSWGVMGFAYMPSPKGPPAGEAYYRLKAGEFETVGRVVVMTPDMAQARDTSLATMDQVLAEQGLQRPDDAEDAARWRALIGCARLRIMGSAGSATDEYQHVGLEVWTQHPAPTEPRDVARLIAFTDKVIELERVPDVATPDA